MQSSYILVNGLRMHYRHSDLSQAGRPMLLLHGLASNARIWDKAAPYLAQGGYNLYALDQRGHGLSDQAESGYDFDSLRQDVAGFIAACDLVRPVIIGHSWGAMVALDYGAHVSVGPRAPAALVFADGAQMQIDQIPGATWESTRQMLTPPRLAGTPLASFLERLSAPNRAWQLDEQDKEIILANFAIDADERISPHLTFEHHMQIVEAMWKFQTYSLGQSVRCPALQLPARPSLPIPDQEANFLAIKAAGVERLCQLNRLMQVQWMEDSVHDFPLQRPELMARRVLDFLTEAL